MKFDFYIARKLTEKGKNQFTSWILRLAISAVAISIAVMILANCLIAGFKEEISQKIFNFWGHISISKELDETRWDLVNMTYDSSLVEKILSTEISDTSIFGQVADPVKAVEHIQAIAQFPAIMQSKDELEGILLKGIGSDFRQSFYKQYLVAGLPLQTDLDKDSVPELVVSQNTADRLNLEVGKKLRLVFVIDDAQKVRVFKVSGIYKTGLEEYDKKIALASISEIRSILGWDDKRIGGYELFVSNLDKLDRTEMLIYESILPPELFSNTIRAKFPAIFDWLRIQDYNEWVILLLMSIVCIINMVTVILILVLERTRMVGILKALGARNQFLRNLFMFYGAKILFKGLVWGNAIGLGLAAIQYYFRPLRLPEADYYLSYAPIRFHFDEILLINFAVIAVVSVCLLIPLLIVRGISPVKAIRFD